MSALLALWLAGPAAAQASWSVVADSAPLVGAETRLVYRAPAGAAPTPDALASGTTDFVVVKVEAQKDGTWAWSVLPLNVGALSFTARWTQDGKPVEAPPARLAVGAPSVPRDADIADIKPPRRARPRLWPWLLAALLGAAGWEAWRRWRARPGARAGSPADPPLPPESAAERALAALAASGLWERGEHAAYYLRLTDILRSYLEARYGELATAMTSVEVARLVKSRTADLRTAAAVREVLARADLVKFARIKPDANEGPGDLGLARAVVAATTPVELSTAAGGAAR